MRRSPVGARVGRRGLPGRCAHGAGMLSVSGSGTSKILAIGRDAWRTARRDTARASRRTEGAPESKTSPRPRGLALVRCSSPQDAGTVRAASALELFRYDYVTIVMTIPADEDVPIERQIVTSGAFHIAQSRLECAANAARHLSATISVHRGSVESSTCRPLSWGQPVGVATAATGGDRSASGGYLSWLTEPRRAVAEQPARRWPG